MQRDFTYVDDAVAGVLAAADAPAEGPPRHRIYNLGNSRPVAVSEMIAVLEKLLGREAKVELLPAQPGEAPVTYADISAAGRDLG
jgi:UDP-glucuronate 4-epimerase